MKKISATVRRSLLVSIIVFLFLANSYANGQVTLSCSPAESSAKRLAVFISDLHLGVGKYPNTEKWNEMEDFRWENEFKLFLEEINRMGSGKTDLVINGDLLELWQFVKDNCDYGDPDLGCTEKDALKRVQDVLKSHSSEIRILKEFADSPGQNRVYIVPGNHDTALLYNDVAKEIVQQIGATPGKVCVLPNGYWRSSDGLIYAEHGHQIEGDINSYKEKWPNPFIEKQGKTYLIRTLGERFVQKYYNPYEVEYPIIDNLSEEWLGIKYAVAARGLSVTASKDLPELAQFILFKVSGGQFISGVLKYGEESATPDWNVEQIRKEWDDKFISDLYPVMEKLLPSDSIDRIVINKIAEEGKPARKPSCLSDKEILTVCDLRANLITSSKEQGQTISISKCPVKGETLALFTKLVKRNDQVLKERIQKSYDELPAEGGIKPPKFQVFIYGHTHKAHDGEKYKIELPGYWVPKVFNSGAWIRVIDPDQLKKLVEKKGLEKSAILPKLQPEDLPPSYSFVIVKPYDQNPTAELKYWVLDSKGAWKISDTREADD